MELQEIFKQSLEEGSLGKGFAKEKPKAPKCGCKVIPSWIWLPAMMHSLEKTAPAERS